MTVITTSNPATGAVLRTYDAMSTAEIDAAVHAATRAQPEWAHTSFEDRAKVLHAAAEELRARSRGLAEMVSNEMGKPLRESIAEIEKSAVGLDYYATNAERFLQDEVQDTAADHCWVSYEPIGIVLAIMPWNFPLWQVFRFASPALMAGNAALLKHSPNTTGSALETQAILAAAGLPDGLFTALLIAEPDVPTQTERLISDPRISAVTITGSERAGSAVGAIAGREIKKSVLELGGSDPFVVLADADVATVASAAVKARFLNAGQSCVSPKRFIVEDSVVEEFTRLVCERVAALTIGDPRDDTTDVGPMARRDLRDQLAEQVDQSVKAGAVVRIGGRAVDAPGFFYEPTVLTGIRPGSVAYHEELFGPVLSIISVRDQNEAVQVANDTRFGLGASVWGGDLENAVSVGRRIVSGACFINSPVASDPSVPFGGTKHSGYGRELWSAGIREFVNVRTWWTMDCPVGSIAASE